MEPFVKRSWLIDSVVIIILALILSYMQTYHVESIISKFQIVALLVFYYIGKGVQKYNDKKDFEEKLKKEKESRIETDVETKTKTEDIHPEKDA